MRTLLLIMTLLSSAQLLADECEFSRDINRVLEAAALDELEVAAGAGLLRISGDTKTKQIKIEARLCAETKKDLQAMDVVSKSSGKQASIRTRIPDSDGWFNNGYRRIDLILTVPSYLALDVDDSSGSARVKGVRSLKMDDSSGSLQVEDIAGDVDVDDSSGSLEFENIGGSVTVSDSSGSITARDIGGHFHVESDSSGQIDGKRIKGDFIVDRDSSGSINAKQVGGDFIVHRDGSGGIHYSEIQGKVEIPERKR